MDSLKEWGFEDYEFGVVQDEDVAEEKEFDLEDELWFLNIEFEDEAEAQSWYEKLLIENLNIKIVQ